MNLRTVEYIAQEAFTGIKRNGLMAFASITTIALTLTILGTFIMSAIGANKFVNAQVSKFEIAVFVKTDSYKVANKIANQIQLIPDVEKVEIHSREDEWEKFKKENPNIDSAGLKENPLPYKLDVKVKNQSKSMNIANKIRQIEGVDKVNEGREALKNILALAHIIRVVSIIGVVLLIFATAFLISNAIRLTLYARRHEIRIMQLVGATNQFIRIPLIIEGVVFGALGAVVAWLILQISGGYASGAVIKISPLLGSFSSGISSVQLLLMLMISGIVLGACGSIISIRRFLQD
ncbi:MAG: permease-like cell division protein FtsX [Armatimonadota bacterium]